MTVSAALGTNVRCLYSVPVSSRAARISFRAAEALAAEWTRCVVTLGFSDGKLRPTEAAALPEAARGLGQGGGLRAGAVGSRAALTFQAGDEDLHGAGVVHCLLRVPRPGRQQQGQADQGQSPPHRECWQDADS